MQRLKWLMKGMSLIASVLVARSSPSGCSWRWWDSEPDRTGFVPRPLSLGGWGLQEGSGSISAFLSLLSALIHFMNYTWKQLHTEWGAGKETSLTIN